MSVKVDLGELAARVEGFDFAYLVTVGEDRRAHLVAATPALDGDHFVVDGLGRQSTTNAAANHDVTLVWPPPSAGGYSLIVDGTATVGGTSITVRPTKAVLHRPAIDAAGARSGSDCLPVDVGDR